MVVWWAWAAYAWLTNTLLAPSVVIATARTAGGLSASLIAYEAIHFGEARRRVRTAAHAE